MAFLVLQGQVEVLLDPYLLAVGCVDLTVADLAQTLPFPFLLGPLLQDPYLEVPYLEDLAQAVAYSCSLVVDLSLEALLVLLEVHRAGRVVVVALVDLAGLQGRLQVLQDG